VRNWIVFMALLTAACGGRTAVEGDLGISAQASAGNGGVPAVSLDWSEIVWDGTFAEAAPYLWTGSVNDTWAVTTDEVGSFHREHWDGTGWTRTDHDQGANALFEGAQVWTPDDGEAFGGSSRNLERWVGRTWTDWEGTPGCSAIGGLSRDELWCATRTELWRLLAGSWSRQSMPGIHGILALARTDVWVWGELGAEHFNGFSWSHELDNLVKRVSASGPNDVWLVQDGNLLHSNGPGGPWTRQNPTGGQIASVWSESATNTWIVAAGAAMRWNGSNWELMPLPMQDERLYISGSSEDIWIAGTQLLVHGHPARR